jgi:hypothetical protein
MRLNSTDGDVQRSAEHWTFCLQVIVSLLVSVFMVGFKTNAVRNIYYGLKRKKEVLSLKQHLSEAQSPPRLTIEASPANPVEDAGAAAAAAAAAAVAAARVRTPRALQSSQAQNRRVSDIQSNLEFLLDMRMPMSPSRPAADRMKKFSTASEFDSIIHETGPVH